MKVLLIGSGGREHAIAWKLAQSPSLTQLWCWPGNPGTSLVATNVGKNVDETNDIVWFAKENKIDLAIIGPEDPLASGLSDKLRAGRIAVFGPSKAATQIEADKWFAKELMRQQRIPTAEARSFIEAKAADEYVRTRDVPCVVKAAGLAKGKGVSVCRNVADALAAIDRIMRKKEFGEAGARLVVEEMLSGPECSVMALVDKRTIYVLEAAQDHKPVNDGDTGPMTGGMGAYSPTPVITPELLSQIERDVLVPAVDGLLRDGIEYSGVLYAGLMLTTNGPRVLEFNCRFGDPETQPLLMRLKSDLLDVFMAVANGTLDQIELDWDPRPAVCVVATSGGYPGAYARGQPITGIESAQADSGRDRVQVFQGGTRLKDGKLLTDGGRVLSVTALGENTADAQRAAYAAIKKIHFEGMHYRLDIAYQALK